MLDRVCAQLGVVHYMCGRSWFHNISTGMGLGLSGYILDIPSEKHLEVVQQTCNHILQMSPPVVACHEALLLPQLLVVCWWAELSSVEQVRPPVHVCIHVCMYVCVCMYTAKND